MIRQLHKWAGLRGVFFDAFLFLIGLSRKIVLETGVKERTFLEKDHSQKNKED